MNRREALTTLAVLTPAVTAIAGGKPMKENEKPGPATSVEPPKPGGHSIAPLPFDPAKLKGLSERMLRSHHEDNYGGAVGEAVVPWGGRKWCRSCRGPRTQRGYRWCSAPRR